VFGAYSTVCMYVWPLELFLVDRQYVTKFKNNQSYCFTFLSVFGF